jgi:hypothetical protein
VLLPVQGAASAAFIISGNSMIGCAARPTRRRHDEAYAGDIEAWEVGPEVGNVRNNRPELMKRVAVREMRHAQTRRPPSEFDPSRPPLVYDHLNDETFEWLPDRHGVDYSAMPLSSTTGLSLGIVSSSMAGRPLIH